MLHAFDRVLQAAPGRVFLDFSGAQWTYAEFDRLSTRFAHSLRQLGVRPGDTVMTVLDNNVDAVTAWFAINKIGAISVPINTALRGEFLRHQLNDAGGSVVICEAAYLPRIVEICAGLPARPPDPVSWSRRRHPLPAAVPIEPLDAHRGTRRLADRDHREALGHVLHHLYVGHDGPIQGQHAELQLLLPPRVAAARREPGVVR